MTSPIRCYIIISTIFSQKTQQTKWVRNFTQIYDKRSYLEDIKLSFYLSSCMLIYFAYIDKLGKIVFRIEKGQIKT